MNSQVKRKISNICSSASRSLSLLLCILLGFSFSYKPRIIYNTSGTQAKHIILFNL